MMEKGKRGFEESSDEKIVHFKILLFEHFEKLKH
jgi:hypothetical protein